MTIEGAEYVAAVYAVVLATVIVWMCMIAAKVRRLDRQAQQRPTGPETR